MEIVIKIAQLLLSLSILIILHEFGHFIFAKLFKTRVEKFYLFFNPGFALFKFKKGETEYGMGWLPLGGYVKISGMIDESMDKEAMKEPPKPYEFRSKPAWQRLFIMLGGVLMNAVLAFLIYSGILFVWGEEYLPAENAKYGIMVDSLARETGLQDGDKILALDREPVDDFFKIVPDLVLNEVSTIQVMRDGRMMDISVSDEIIPDLLNSPGFVAPRFPFILDRFAEESVAKEAGMKKGDRFIGFNGYDVRFYDQVTDSIEANKGEAITVSVLRDKDTLTFPMEVPPEGKLGVYANGNLSYHFDLKKHTYSFLQSIPAGFDRGVETFVSYLKQLRLIFSPETKAYKSVGGFITIGSIFPGEWNWQSFWSLTAFLSIILAIMNLLPIPALDGGHVMFLMYEIISGRKPSDKFMEYAQMTGMILILALLIFANGNDIIKLFN